MTKTPAEIVAECERLIALSEAATKGPWFRDSCEFSTGVSQGTSYKDRGVEIIDECTYTDAAFIAAARESLPRLARLVKRLVEENQTIGELLICAVAFVPKPSEMSGHNDPDAPWEVEQTIKAAAAIHEKYAALQAALRPVEKNDG